MSRLPSPASEDATCEKLRLTDPSDVDVYVIGVTGASGLQPRLATRIDIRVGGLECRTAGRRGIGLGGLECPTAGMRGISLSGLECPTDDNYEVGEIEIEHRIAPRTTDENAKELWQLIQRDRNRRHYQMRRPESLQVHTIRDDGPLCDPDEGKVLSGQLEPGLVLHACLMTVEGRSFLYSESKQDVAVINQEGSGSSAGVTAGLRQENQTAETFDTPDDELDNNAAYAFGEKLC